MEKEEESKTHYYLYESQRVSMDFYVNLSEFFIGEGLQRKHISLLFTSVSTEKPN